MGKSKSSKKKASEIAAEEEEEEDVEEVEEDEEEAEDEEDEDTEDSDDDEEEEDEDEEPKKGKKGSKKQQAKGLVPREPVKVPKSVLKSAPKEVRELLKKREELQAKGDKKGLRKIRAALRKKGFKLSALTQGGGGEE